MISLDRHFIGLLTGFALAVAVLASAQEARADEAEEFIAGFADRVVKEILEPELPDPERGRRIRSLLADHMDSETVARFVLGRYWRQTDVPTRAAFINAFEASLAHNVLTLLKGYTDEKLFVEGSQQLQKDGALMIVTSRIVQQEGNSFAVDWRLKRGDKDYRIIDVATEGVSMAITLRAEYSSFLKRQGDVAALTAALERRLVFAEGTQPKADGEPAQ